MLDFNVPTSKSPIPIRFAPAGRFYFQPGFSYSHILLTDSLTISGEIFA